MPLWALIYVVLFAAVTVSGAVLCLRDDGISFRGICDSCAPIVFAYFFTSFWLPQLRSPLGLFASALFLAAFAWEAYSWPADRRKTNANNELSEREKRVFKVFLLVFVLPLYAIAAVAVFRAYVRA
jgi:hypothetical protein